MNIILYNEIIDNMVVLEGKKKDKILKLKTILLEDNKLSKLEIKKKILNDLENKGIGISLGYLNQILGPEYVDSSYNSNIDRQRLREIGLKEEQAELEQELLITNNNNSSGFSQQSLLINRDNDNNNKEIQSQTVAPISTLVETVSFPKFVKCNHELEIAELKQRITELELIIKDKDKEIFILKGQITSIQKPQPVSLFSNNNDKNSKYREEYEKNKYTINRTKGRL